MLFVVCVACEANASYPVRDYLSDLALKSGIGSGTDPEEDFEKLCSWGVTEEGDSSFFDEDTDYGYLARTIVRLMEKEGEPLAVLKDLGYVPSNVREKQKVTKEEAAEVIWKAVSYINDKEFTPCFEYGFLKQPKSEEEELSAGDLLFVDGAYRIVTKVSQDGYESRETDYPEVFEYFDLETSSCVDFTQAEVVPYGIEDTSYVNERYILLSSSNHVFHSEGFRISYTLNSYGIDLHISKNENGLNVYLDAAVKNVKPRISWHSRENDLKNCFFSLSFDTVQKLGVSTGKYKNYHLKFKDLDPSSFQALLKSMIEPISDDMEASIPICRIKVPIADIPTMFLDLDLLIKIHASGKAEIVLNDSHGIGFETKNGKIRWINDHSHDLNTILQASSKSVLGVNVGLETAGMKLADLETDVGIRALVRSTLHLYDEDGKQRNVSSGVPYSGLDELSDGNPDVLVCGDLSLNWIGEATLNTSKTQMNKLGFTRSFTFLDESDQVFGNRHHIENGHFVERCTRSDRNSPIQMTPVASDKIVLDSYAEVLPRNGSYQIIVKSLPEGYSESDLVYSSENEKTASVSQGMITAHEPGSVRIKVSTKDDRYASYVNILVSTQ